MTLLRYRDPKNLEEYHVNPTNLLFVQPVGHRVVTENLAGESFTYEPLKIFLVDGTTITNVVFVDEIGPDYER